MVKVLQTSKNLLQKMENTAVMEKAGSRSLEDLSSIHNYLWELRHIRKALWALCFNLQNRSKKSDMDGWKALGRCVRTVFLSRVLGAARHKGRPRPVGPCSLELFITHTGLLPAACLLPLPGRSLAVCTPSTGIKLALPLLFPDPHQPTGVHQGLKLTLILFKRGKSDSKVSLEAIYTWPLATAPTPPVCCAITTINRKFLWGKLDCCSIREAHRQYISI